MTDVHLDKDVAANYDKSVSDAFSSKVVIQTVDFLSRLAGDNAALEFAVGTGRIGLPLSEKGIQVSGIEFSDPMLDQLRAKPGAEKVNLVLGDMATTCINGEFGLVYLIFNTIMNLTDQSQQVACFKNAAAHLTSGGYFVIEVMVPRLRHLSPGSRHLPFSLGEDHIGYDEYVDFNRQILKSHHVYNRDGRFDRMAGSYRWVWPSELDLMAELAGMNLVERWADWDRSPFTDESDKHVSVWQKL